MSPEAPQAGEGRLAENIIHFTRALRKAGVKVGTAQVETAIRAVAAAGFTKRADFYYTLRATLITRAEDIEVFGQIFAMFWRDPDFLEQMMNLLTPQVRDDTPPPPPPAARKRAADAMAGRRDEEQKRQPEEQIVTDMTMSMSDTARLRAMDFEQMSAAELAEASVAIRELRLPVRPLPVRRTRPARQGARPDPRATMRAMLRRGGEMGQIARRAPGTRPPDLVVLCDISGSMSVYSRMVLRYVHALAHAPQRHWGRVSAFTFGTELTNVTRALMRGEPDAALAAAGQTAGDWEGGTRIGPALARFNRDWARRVLPGGAVVLLITDGLERGAPATLAAEAARLGRTARQLLWLNPLLRWEGFRPEAAGIRALLPHVDSLHACHSLASLADLSAALSDRGPRRAA